MARGRMEENMSSVKDNGKARQRQEYRHKEVKMNIGHNPPPWIHRKKEQKEELGLEENEDMEVLINRIKDIYSLAKHPSRHLSRTSIV